MRNRLRRQQQELEQRQKSKYHMDSTGQQTSSRRRNSALRPTGSTSLKTSGRGRPATQMMYAGSNQSSPTPPLICNESGTLNDGTHYNPPEVSPTSYNQLCSNVAVKYSSVNAYSYFTEPSAYSLDILLSSDECDSLIDSNYVKHSLDHDNTFVSPPTPSPTSGDIFYSNTVDPSNSSVSSKTNTLIDPKKEDFYCSSNELEEGLRFASSSLSSSLNDCCGYLFNNNIDSIDLFDNDLDNMDITNTTAANNNLSNEFNLYHTGIPPMYASDTADLALDFLSLSSDLVEIKKGYNENGVRKLSIGTTSSDSYVKAECADELELTIPDFDNQNANSEFNKNDFTQYLLHDNDPFPFQQEAGSINLNVNSTQSSKYANRVNCMVNTNTSPYMSVPKSCAFEANRSQYNPDKDNQKPKAQELAMMKHNSHTHSNYLANYLQKSDDQCEEYLKYDPVMEFFPRISSNSSPLKDMGFSNRELILPERCLIKELSDACSILKNPYKRIIYITFSSQDTPHQCHITEFFIHRLIRMSKRLSSFSQLSLNDQVNLLKCGLIEMLCLRSVLLYDNDRESWCFLDVGFFPQNILPIFISIFFLFESSRTNVR